MYLTFPRSMPASGVGGQKFEPQRVDFLSPERKGRIGAMAAGFPLWSAEWTLGGSMGATLSDDWRAFISSLDGPGRLFLGYEHGREYPRAHPKGFDGMVRHGSGAFDGSASSWTQSITADGQAILTLTNVPDALAISPGDYVDFRWTSAGGERRTLVRSLQSVTPAGGSVAMAVTPAVPAVTPSDAVAHLDNPACLMRLTPDTQVSAMDRRRVAGATIVAIQDLLS